MAINFNDNIKVSANKPLDFKFGPFESVTQANSLIPESQRHHGLIFGVYTLPLDLANSDIEYYYYWDDLSDTSYKRLLLEQNFLDAINASQNASGDNPFLTESGLIQNLNAVFVPAEDYESITFDRLGGYIYGSPEAPLSAAQLSLDFTDSTEFSQVVIYHQSDSVPTFDGLDTPNNVKIVGSYVTSELNRIVIIHEGDENITIGYINNTGGTAIQDGVEVVGTIDITTPTTADLSGFTYRIAGVQFTSGTLTDIAITGTPTNYPRTDFFIGKFNPSFPSGGVGIVEYLPGTESEDQVILPVIPPNAVLLGSVIRNIDGSNVFEPIDPDLSDFVSKSALSNQTIQSELTLVKKAGLLPNYATFGTNGMINRSNPALAGMFSTLSGVGGFSKILTITIDPALQVNYYAIIEFHGISTNYEKGFLWVQFEINGSGDIITNKLKCFGEFDVNKYTLIKTSTSTYDLFVAHDETDSFYKFRPSAQFGSSFRYVYHNLIDKVESLPSGDQFEFTLFGGSTGAGAGLSIDGDGNVQLGNDGTGFVNFSDRSVFENGFKVFFNSYDEENEIEIIQNLILDGEGESRLDSTYNDNLNEIANGAVLEASTNIGGAAINIEKSTFDGNQAISFSNSTNKVIFSDDLNEKGFEYSADYSAVGTLDPRWIPDWGAVEEAVADATPDDYTPQTGTTLAFDGPNKYGFNGTPLTGNLTFASTGAKETVMVKALHNAGTEPTLTPPGGVTLIKEGADYTISVDNILYAICHKNDAGAVTKISYSWTINQP